jgi:hypothetical protein
LGKVVESYSGRLRRRYTEAEVKIQQNGYPGRKEAKIKAFVKAEKFNPVAKLSKPRLILGRSPEYTLELASYLKPLEHDFWKRLKSRRSWGVPKTRIVGKGLNANQRAELVRTKLRDGFACFEADGKAFEAHQDRWQLQQEHAVYLAAYHGDRRLQKLLGYQLNNRGHTACGIKFGRSGGRASGDFNTGLGNTIVMIAVVVGALEQLRAELGNQFAFDILADGDNALVFLPTAWMEKVYSGFYETVLRTSGHEVTLENMTVELERVTFGQSRPVLTGAGLTMVRDPMKTLSHSFCGHKHYGDLAYGRRVLKSIAQCELSLSRGVPVLQTFFEVALLELEAEQACPEAVDEYRYTFVKGDLRGSIPVTVEARTSFARAWGIDVDTQVEMEARFAQGNLRFPESWEGMPLDPPFGEYYDLDIIEDAREWAVHRGEEW